MSLHQRTKGRRFELECLAYLRDRGIDGELRYEQSALGGRLGDIESTAGNWECKRRAELPAWLEPAENVRGVFCRRDRGELLVVVRARDYFSRVAELAARSGATPGCGGRCRCAPGRSCCETATGLARAPDGPARREVLPLPQDPPAALRGLPGGPPDA